MSVIITREDLIAYSEVDYIIKHMNARYIAKVPKNILTFFETIKDPDYEVYVDPHKPLQSQGLQKYTLEIIALLHVKYWCQDPQRKEELIERMRMNQEKFEAKLREQFNADNIFENQNDANKVSNMDPMVSAYSKYMNQNPDIQDYTDLKEEQEESQPQEMVNVHEKVSIIQKIKSFFLGILKKSTD